MAIVSAVATIRATASRTIRDSTRVSIQCRSAVTTRHRAMITAKTTSATNVLPIGYQRPGGS